jgi:hypothetical protein
MSTDSVTNKRTLVRLLCNASFGDSVLTCAEQSFVAKSINYNHQGICVFTYQRIPDVDTLEISFSYQQDGEEVSVSNIPCQVVYALFTETGDQFGLRFLWDDFDSATQNQLKRIEALLEKNTDDQNRYGLDEKC